MTETGFPDKQIRSTRELMPYVPQNWKQMAASLPLSTKILAGKARVRVTFGGNEAYCQRVGGKFHINLPQIPADDPEMVVLAYGYRGHEVGHVRHSDYDALEKAELGSVFEKTMCNVIEDVWMERAMGEEFPGVRGDLNRLWTKLVRDETVLPATESESPATIVQRFVLTHCRAEYTDQEAFVPISQTSEATAEKILGRGLVTRLKGLLSKVPTLKGTDDALALASRIISLLEEERDRAKQPPEDEEAPPVDSPANLPETLQSILDAKDADVDEDALKKVAGSLSASTKKASHGEGQIGGIAEPDPLGLTKLNASQTVSDVRAATNALRHRLGGLLDAERDRRVWNCREGEEIDSDQIHKVALQEPDIFKREQKSVDVFTAVQVLLDRSGSMGDRIKDAMRAALAIGLALEQIPDVRVAVACFPGTAETRVIPLTHFGQSVRGTAGFYEAITASGGTPMTEAIYYGTYELIAVHEERKILFVVTDGAPNDRESCERALQAAERYGVEAYGIGIGTMANDDLFRHYAVINDILQLAPAMFQMLERALVRAAA